MKKLLLLPVIFVIAFSLVNFLNVSKAYALSCSIGGSQIVSTSGTGIGSSTAVNNCCSQARAMCSNLGGSTVNSCQNTVSCDRFNTCTASCSYTCKIPPQTWTCTSTACSNSSSSSSDNYCTYLSSVSCGSSVNTCHYSSASTYDSRCGATCPSGNCAYSSDPAAPSGLSSSVAACTTNAAPPVTVSWTKGARTTAVDVFYCDNTVAQQTTGLNCKPDDASIDSSRWFHKAKADATSPYTMTGLTQGHIYWWLIRARNCNGSTNSAISSFTVSNCSKPNLTVSSFTFPDGYAGAAGTASVTVANIGNATASNFVVKVVDGITTNVYTQTVSSLAAGTSTTLTYSITEPLTAGTFTATATADSGNTVTELNESDNTATDAYTVTGSIITANVYQDLNGNAARDCANPLVLNYPTCTGSIPEPIYQGATVNINGANYTTNASGQVVSPSLLPNTYPVTLTVPNGFKLKTLPNPKSVTLPPSQTVNFGIQPPAPTCSGGLTASRNSVGPGGTSTLTCNTPSSLTNNTINYYWYPDSAIVGFSDSVNPVSSTTNTTTWAAPGTWWTQVTANPSVAVCNPGGIGSGTLCTNYQTAITIVPKFSISGNVFVDQNKDGLIAGDSNYNNGTSTIQIRTGSCGGPLVQTVSTANGIYTTGSNLVGGDYYVCYASLPAGYQMTNPVNGPPSSFSVRVGNVSTGGACSESSNSATCDANGNITSLNYGITNSIPWIQTTGGDPYGVSSPIPSTATAACGGPYMSLQGNGGTPGVVYCGSGSCTGTLGAGQASRNPYNWQVGGETYTGKLKTSYNKMYSTALRSGITPTPLGTTQCGLGGTTNCVLSGTLANGVYIVTNGSLNLTGGSYTFPANKDFVILVNGDLNINTEIHVPTTSTVFFTASGNINVGSNVGNADITSPATNIEGYYSTDKSFYPKSLDVNGSGANCPTSDKRLNIGGAVVVNAGGGGGAFHFETRDLCAGDLQCPTSTVIERPDFILNSPDFLKTTRRVWQEIAP